MALKLLKALDCLLILSQSNDLEMKQLNATGLVATNYKDAPASIPAAYGTGIK